MEQSNLIQGLSSMEGVEIVLEEDEKIVSICTRWREWEAKVKETQCFHPLPFSEIERNYFDSKLLDELALLESLRKPPNKRASTTRSARWRYPSIDSEAEISRVFNHGMWYVIQWLYRNFEIDFQFDSDQYFNRACRHGHLRVAQWYYNTYNACWFDKTHHLHSFWDYPIMCATMSGNLDLVKWLYSLTEYEDRTMINMATDATKQGHFHILKWLAKVKSLAITNYAFREAIHFERLEMGKWMIDNFPQILNYANNIMCDICRRGTIEQAEWFINTFPQVNPFNGRYGTYSDPFYTACRCGKLKMAKWILGKYPLVITNISYIFRMACGSKNLAMTKWLLETFPDINVEASRGLVQACLCHDLKMVEWLVKITNGHENEPNIVNQAFAVACAHGPLVLLVRLYALFPDVNPSWSREYAFRWTCRAGNLVIVKWLHGTFPQINIHAEGDEAMMNASLHERLEVVRWLCSITRFPRSVYRRILEHIEERRSRVLEFLIDEGYIAVHDALDILSRRGGLQMLVDSLLSKYSQSKRRRIQ